jgi:hypothetical protein
MELIHYGSNTYNPELFKPVTNHKPASVNKPIGGLWVSPTNCEWSWKDFCEAEDFRIDKLSSSFKLKLKDGVRIYKIDSLDDLTKLVKSHSWKNIIDCYELDFEKLSKDYDVIYLTYEGMGETRLSQPMDLNAWDCECMLIMNPNCFEII